jgi:hypothetical protein
LYLFLYICIHKFIAPLHVVQQVPDISNQDIFESRHFESGHFESGHFESGHVESWHFVAVLFNIIIIISLFRFIIHFISSYDNYTIGIIKCTYQLDLLLLWIWLSRRWITWKIKK